MPILRDNELDIISHSVEQTQRIGARLGALLQAGDVICLAGDMGAGKTVFTAGIGRGWGAITPVTSPTFNLVHEHRREKDALRLIHIDCYRLQGVGDLETIGFDDLLERNGVLIIEWPERIEDALPKEKLWIEFSILETTRRSFLFEADGARYQQLLNQFKETTFGV